jgi:hypothetical protein
MAMRLPAGCGRPCPRLDSLLRAEECSASSEDLALEGEIDAGATARGFTALTEPAPRPRGRNATAADDAVLASRPVAVGLCSRSRILLTRATNGKTSYWVKGNFDESA